MKLDLLFAEIGSTTTVVTAFHNLDGNVKIVGQGEHWTTVNEGDVTIGIERAIGKLKEKIGEKKLTWDKFAASSSAAGGLKMTVHGLVYDMTVRAAREAALGAGAVIKYVTAGKMDDFHIQKIKEIQPKLILLAGGVDYGEKETVIHNAKVLSKLDLDIPIIYAGNVAVAEQVEYILKNSGKTVFITENVYPKIDQLNVEPTRNIIKEIFAQHITKAPGMEKIYEIVDYNIHTTPGAVMRTTQLLSEIYEDVLTIDIGGATTDVDSVTEGSNEIQELMIAPEPKAKRTVEGDLGLFVNARNVINLIGEENLRLEFPNLSELKTRISPYPKTDEDEKFIAKLALYCFQQGIRRHVGIKKHIYTPLGRKLIAEGKDLTAIKYLFGTGGFLSRSKYAPQVLKSINNLSKLHPMDLLPQNKVKIFRDKYYIFAAIGVISTEIDKDFGKKILEKDIEEIGG
ncbi:MULTISPECIES: GlmL-related ornithine degradation protein [unclassified Thermosipho (in: thermotogales)]|uniref:GlmL-related ornithine degradation protein n=1 Tax=unclassified Thermosipho (in: thermotogales) TaxID=2676525 RepID=UPI000986C089|nr:GlmL-related ornithine degradation protein [Thermosipho sp. 1223]MBT1247225.1 DNA mismatch repair protein MutL [Thermosipho sp. 1244]OOC47204.1 DNA mismatch repair protein MutL [Thermosipho sp. 1223]